MRPVPSASRSRSTAFARWSASPVAAPLPGSGLILAGLLVTAASLAMVGCGSGGGGGSAPATEVPGAPTGLACSDLGTPPVRLSWVAAATGGAAASYAVERAPDQAGSPGTFVAQAAGITVTQWDDGGAKVRTTVWYRVRGSNAAGDGAWSGPRSCTTVDAARLAAVAEDVVIDFGRTWPHRKLTPTDVPHRDAFWAVDSLASLSGIIPTLASSVLPAGSVDLCGYDTATLPPQAGPPRTWIRTRPELATWRATPDRAAHYDPMQYPPGLTCVWAVVTRSDPNVEMGFTLWPVSSYANGNLYAAVPVPSKTLGGAAIPVQSTEQIGGAKTVADLLPGGLIEGSMIDTVEKMAAYDATLAALARGGALPLPAPVASSDALQPLLAEVGAPLAAWQALPILWEAPSDPDPMVVTHDCVGHREQVKLFGGDGVAPYDPACTIPRGGTSSIQSWLRRSIPSSSPATADAQVAYPAPVSCAEFAPASSCMDIKPTQLDCGVQDSAQAITCCEPERPFLCPALNRCYATEAGALAACGNACHQCALSGGASNSTGALARLDGTYGALVEWSATHPYSYDEIIHVDVAVSGGRLTVTTSDPSCAGWNCFGLGMTGTGTVRADGYGTFTLSGKSESGAALQWTCGITLAHSIGTDGTVYPGYSLRGACTGTCQWSGAVSAGCYARLI